MTTLSTLEHSILSFAWVQYLDAGVYMPEDDADRAAVATLIERGYLAPSDEPGCYEITKLGFDEYMTGGAR